MLLKTLLALLPGIIYFSTLTLWNAKSVEASYLRNGEIFNIGWIFSLPYDIGNTLRAPLGGPLSLVLTACLSLIMFFGMVASPVYYLLGTPKRKYHVEDAIRTRPLLLPSPSKKGRSFLTNPFDFDMYNRTVEEELNVENEFPDFVDSMFNFLPEYNENCKKLMVCHSHGFFSLLPTYFLQIYRVFSSKMMAIPQDYQFAVQVGLEDQGKCAQVFDNCTSDLQTMVRRAVFGIIFGDIDPYMDSSDFYT